MASRMWSVGVGLAFLFSLAGPALAQSSSATIGIWLPGPAAAGDPTYVGAIEQPASSGVQLSSASVQLTGWVVDRTAQGWSGIDQIQVWDGPMGYGGQHVADASIALNRPDVAAALNDRDWAASGFSASVANTNQAQATGVLYVYAHTPAKGWWYMQQVLNLAGAALPQNPELDIQSPTPLATVHSNKPYTMLGSAIDPSAGPGQGSGIDRVQVYLNGDRKTGTYIGDAVLGRSSTTYTSLQPQFARAGWELTFQPASWLSNISDNQITPLTVYAHSSVTGQETSTSIDIVVSVP